MNETWVLLGYCAFTCRFSFTITPTRCFSLITLATFSAYLQNLFFALFSHPWTLLICMAMFDCIPALLMNHGWVMLTTLFICAQERAMHTKNVAFTAVAFYEPQTLGSWIRNPSTAQILILLLVVLAVSLYAHFVISVIQEITSALGIYCFRYQTRQFHYQVLCLSLFLHFSSYRFIEQIVPLGLEWF